MRFTASTIGVIAAVAVAGVGAVAFLVTSTSRSCSYHEHVEARVALVSSQLQQAAAQGKLKVEQLAAGIKRMNEAATAYETAKDAQAYCDALDKLSADYAAD